MSRSSLSSSNSRRVTVQGVARRMCWTLSPSSCAVIIAVGKFQKVCFPKGHTTHYMNIVPVNQYCKSLVAPSAGAGTIRPSLPPLGGWFREGRVGRERGEGSCLVEHPKPLNPTPKRHESWWISRILLIIALVWGWGHGGVVSESEGRAIEVCVGGKMWTMFLRGQGAALQGMQAEWSIVWLHNAGAQCRSQLSTFRSLTLFFMLTYKDYVVTHKHTILEVETARGMFRSSAVVARRNLHLVSFGPEGIRLLQPPTGRVAHASNIWQMTREGCMLSWPKHIHTE